MQKLLEEDLRTKRLFIIDILFMIAPLVKIHASSIYAC